MFTNVFMTLLYFLFMMTSLGYYDNHCLLSMIF